MPSFIMQILIPVALFLLGFTALYSAYTSAMAYRDSHAPQGAVFISGTHANKLERKLLIAKKSAAVCVLSVVLFVALWIFT